MSAVASRSKVPNQSDRVDRVLVVNDAPDQLELTAVVLPRAGYAVLFANNGAEGVNGDEDCSTNAVVPVSAGEHTVDLDVFGVSEPDTRFEFPSLSAIYVPFGADGSPPPP